MSTHLQDGTFAISTEPISSLNFRGDVRSGAPMHRFLRREDRVIVTPIEVSYDEDADRTKVVYAEATQLRLGAGR